MPKLSIIYIPCGSKQEAESIADELLNTKLIACANIFPITSKYQWKNKLQTQQEYILLAKTKQKLFKDVEQKVKQLHSYDCPCILSWGIDNVNKDCADWLEKQVK